MDTWLCRNNKYLYELIRSQISKSTVPNKNPKTCKHVSMVSYNSSFSYSIK